MASSEQVQQEDIRSMPIVLHLRTGNVSILKAQVKALRGYPLLQVCDWMPLAMKHYGLDTPLKKLDTRYRILHSFCTNAVARGGGLALMKKNAEMAELAIVDDHLPEDDAPQVED